MTDFNILLVENNHHQLKAYAERLRLMGYNVIEAADISTAKEILDTANPSIDLGIVDIRLIDDDDHDDWSGIYEIAKPYPNIPMIMITAFPSYETLWYTINPINSPKNIKNYFSKLESSHWDMMQKQIEVLRGSHKWHVFVVHGHNRREEVELFIKDELVNCIPIVLVNNPVDGGTIIEQIEDTDPDFVMALLTKDDEGYALESRDAIEARPRMNVIFELGYFMGKLGRKSGKLAILLETHQSVKLITDLEGMKVIKFDPDGGWKNKVKQQMKFAGIYSP